MSRKINSRLIVTGSLEAVTPIHVGRFGDDIDSDMPLAVNGRNNFYLPGTSLAGAIREWCLRNFGKDKTEKLFGPERVPEKEEGHASFVIIDDAVTETKPMFVEIRDGVRIDGRTGSAADKGKFDRAVLPRGTSFDFEMTVELLDDDNSTKSAIGSLLEAMSREEVRFGGAKTRGLGRMKLDRINIHEEPLMGFDELLDLFRAPAEKKHRKPYTVAELVSAGVTKPKRESASLTIEITWEPVLPTMNKAGYDGFGVDSLPVVSAVDDEKVALVLAGSSVKGAFRAHASRIMNTLTADGSDTSTTPDFIGQLFGVKKERKQKARDGWKPGLAAVSIDDCYAKEKISRNHWQTVGTATADEDISASDWAVMKSLDEIRGPEKTGAGFHIAHHTAIDRFTGGVAEGALYSVLEPHGISWDPIRINIDFARIVDNKECLFLLLLMLRDFIDNRIPLGFATNRGMGEVRVTKIDLKGSGLEKIGLTAADFLSVEAGKLVMSDTLKKLGGDKWWVKKTN